MADQEADVADDAVTDLAKSGQMDEETLLEQRGQRAVKVGRLCKIPETIDQSGRGCRGAEEVRKHSQPFGDQALQFRSLIRRSANFELWCTTTACGAIGFLCLLFYLLIGKQRSTPGTRTMRAILANA